MKISEAEASDQISEILFRDQNLNEVFIDIIEKIHMKQRLECDSPWKAVRQKIDILTHKWKMSYTSMK